MRQSSTLLLAAALIAGAAPLAQAQTAAVTTPTPKAQFDAETQQAKTRYQADQKLCDDGQDAASRMQCKRDASAEYDKALAAAKVRLDAANRPATVASAAKAASAAKPAQTAAACADCGKVVSVTQTEKKGEGSAVGLIAGGVAGAVLGRQIGGGTGRDLATIGGAAGGAYAGREIEKRVKSHKVWVVRVQYANGNTSNFEFTNDPGFKVGDAVKNADKSIVRQ